MLLTPGQRLGPYEILGPLGSGGMAEVHRARDPRLGREVAVKVLPEGVASTPERLARFEREARAVAGLNHPNIVVLHSIEDADGIRFLTMELVDGDDLASVVSPGGLPLPRLLELAIPLAEALGAAHERGVVHRDLKPANVMVTREGRIKVLDFGLAKLASSESSGDTPNDWNATKTASLTSEGAIMGTVPYMAPEQIRGEAVDARTDLFAFGVVLFELATGRRPFRGSNVADITSAILRDAAPPLTSARADLPGELGRLIDRCLEKDLPSRLRSAREAADMLRGLQRPPERRATARPESGAIRSLVVLPLDNVARDGAQEYFVDGMTEALISDLSRLPGLRVISRTSAMRFKGVHKALAEIARELEVDAVLEGSALLLGNRVRISVSLVAARRDETLWSERYDRQLADVLDLQNEVAEKVAQEIALRLSAPEQQRLAKRKAVHPEAHIEFLKGQHSAEANSPQAIEIALRHFQRALELDPSYAPAWAGLAHCHNVRAARGMAPPLQATGEAIAATTRALELDDSLAEAHAELGTSLTYRGEYARALRELERAAELNPGRADTWATLGRIHYCAGRHAEAQQAMHKSVSLDPLSMIHHTSLGDAYYYAREYAKSVPYYRRAIELDPRFDGAHTDLARSLEALGQFDESLREYEEGRRLAGTVAGPSFGLAHLASARGDKAEARRMLEALKAARATKVVSAWGIAALHACLGDADEAFQWLETAVEERASGLVFLRVHPRLDPIRDDPRFAALVQRLGMAGD
jgi:serine/threonine protein kinase/tetratricopeptide (TPR) repeat protein